MGTEADSPLTLVEISSSSSSSSDSEAEAEAEKGIKSEKKRARRYSDVEIWTADEKALNDDDCCILASDPAAGELDLSHPVVSAPEHDNVAVLAVRGKVACRDYPHPRHSCAEYPFSYTSHEDCCSQCYCYVCDVPAPCTYWKGSRGHCHASSENKQWTVKRQASRLAKIWALNSCSMKTSQ